jgi:hypothetical protein
MWATISSILGPLLGIISSISKYFERKQLIDLGEEKAENKALKENEESQDDKRKIHSRVERDKSYRLSVRSFFKR